MFIANDHTGLEGGIKASSSQLLINLHVDKGGIFGDKFDMGYLDNYVCKDCGYTEMYVNDISKLEKIEETKNWKKVIS